MAPVVDVFVVDNLPYPVGFRWDDGDGATVVQLRTQPVDVERLVGQQGTEVKLLDQGGDAYRVMALTRQEHEAHQISQGIHQRDDLGGQASFGSPDGLILSPPLAPLAFC